ncbi:PQQ-dependent sugar dehydrogenase [Acinetobacter tibetensis]|jgi:glucose/arabinose dehydrogenase|uniref:PQQ-dependent sugar dehydrogenase n=1 Tax=Acinetobacter tibetensis TaxID=2943497 RepID=A0AAE9S0I8_9GAMM|nr:PQQ-dependent sugar dehydrogenase [Acinetobacter tibetensis]USE83299.1 PQQ-dependent sugar dehydrogenase [Acinetobacter tibetensis]
MNYSKYGLLLWLGFLSSVSILACHAQDKAADEPNSQAAKATLSQPYKIRKMGEFNEPWAIAVLPDQHLLITEKAGKLFVFNPKTQQKIAVEGVPQVAYGGQGGLGDVVLHPDFKQNHIIYFSYAEQGKGGYGAVVVRAVLDEQLPNQPRLIDLQPIWRQVPKVSGQGHYAHRLAFDSAGKLWISSGERQKFQPAQDMQSNLGKILRLNEDGSPAAGNPFMAQGPIAAQIWSLGHRNPLGMAFDAQGQLWVAEMGPRGGDEFNRIRKSANYGYPIVSNGDHYSGRDIPDHTTRPEFQAPEISWTPVISPSSLIFYRGSEFPKWTNKALIGGLSSQAIIVVDTQTVPVQEVQRLAMKQRIRGLVETQDGSIWGIEDGKNAALFQLTAP